MSKKSAAPVAVPQFSEASNWTPGYQALCFSIARAMASTPVSDDPEAYTQAVLANFCEQNPRLEPEVKAEEASGEVDG